jgi:hypothetical protein
MYSFLIGLMLFLVPHSAHATQVTTAGIADGAVTDVKITSVSQSKVTSGAGVYFSYKPNDVECVDGETLIWVSATDRWICGTGGGGGATTALDNLAATQINASLFFDTGSTYDIGTSADPVNVVYSDNFYGGTGVLNVSAQGGALKLLANTGDYVSIQANGGSGILPLRLYDADSSHYMSIQPASIITTSFALTFPADDGASGEVLSTDGAGVLSWAAAGSPSFPLLPVVTYNPATPPYSFSGNSGTGITHIGDTIYFTSASAAVLALGSSFLQPAADQGLTLGAAAARFSTGYIATTHTSTLRLRDSDDTQYAAIQSPTNLTANYTLTMPADDGASGEVLSTDGAGVLSWAAPGGGGTLTTLTLNSILGNQDVAFSAVPDSGSFDLDWNGGGSPVTINWNDSEATIQTALQTITGLSTVTVNGDVSTGFDVIFEGDVFTDPLPVFVITNNTLLIGATPVTVTPTVTTEPDQTFTITSGDFGKMIFVTGTGPVLVNTPSPGANLGGFFYVRSSISQLVDFQNVPTNIGANCGGMYVSNATNYLEVSKRCP